MGGDGTGMGRRVERIDCLRSIVWICDQPLVLDDDLLTMTLFGSYRTGLWWRRGLLGLVSSRCQSSLLISPPGTCFISCPSLTHVASPHGIPYPYGYVLLSAG